MSLRVGLLCHVGVGGSVRAAVDLAGALATRGHDVHLFARHVPLGMVAPPTNVSLHSIEGNGAVASPKLDVEWSEEEVKALSERVIGVTRGIGLDVLHFHYAVPFAAVVEAVRAELGDDAPALIGTLHGTDVSVQGARLEVRRTLAASLPRLDRLTTVSESHAELAVSTFSLSRPPDVIPNFVDLERFRPGPRAENRRPRVIHVSNFREAKQPLVMARIFRAVRRLCDAELWLVGDGEGMPAVRALLDVAGLSSDTRCFGLRLDVERILPEADVLLVTSSTESFCIAALEAAACLVPAVAPRVGGLPCTVLDGQTGCLFEPGDEVGAADAVARLVMDTELRERLAMGALWHAHRFSPDAVVPRYEQLYERTIRARAGRESLLRAKPAA